MTRSHGLSCLAPPGFSRTQMTEQSVRLHGKQHTQPTCRRTHLGRADPQKGVLGIGPGCPRSPFPRPPPSGLCPWASWRLTWERGGRKREGTGARARSTPGPSLPGIDGPRGPWCSGPSLPCSPHSASLRGTPRHIPAQLLPGPGTAQHYCPGQCGCPAPGWEGGRAQGWPRGGGGAAPEMQ